ncbi:hypothetical protein RvY_13491 [Ramazzottius varieornatus]|uniref:Uncharacterized protein n=1 Tax=Ramazzottius varieornatus TaxID=947166 RepID=A0A1D1VN20_RAMVA|nr:hypothetical protein RvY_13491 [Ramazzottius varieornatus]
MATLGNRANNQPFKPSQAGGNAIKPAPRRAIVTSSLLPKDDMKKLPDNVVPGKAAVLPTLSGLREQMPQFKRQRILQDLVRTAGKENGLLTYRERPAEVRDIYTEDVGNESLVVAYVEHIYNYLHQREMVRLSASYMEGMSVNGRMRAILMDWIVSVAYKFKMSQDTLFLTVDMIDRFLAIPEMDVTKDELQLIGVTCMFIASKFEEVYPPELEDFVFIADQACSKQQILETEQVVCAALQFDFTRPSAAHFLRRCCKAAQASTEEYCLAKYITELSLLTIDFVAELPSKIAAAAMYLTMLMRRGEEEEPVWDADMQYYSFYSEAEVKPLAAKLLEVVKAAPSSRQQCIVKKYSSPKLYEVSPDAAAMATEIEKYFQ